MFALYLADRIVDCETLSHVQFGRKMTVLYTSNSTRTQAEPSSDILCNLSLIFLYLSTKPCNKNFVKYLNQIINSDCSPKYETMEVVGHPLDSSLSTHMQPDQDQTSLEPADHVSNLEGNNLKTTSTGCLLITVFYDLPIRETRYPLILLRNGSFSCQTWAI